MSEKAKSYRNTALLAISSLINIVFSIIKNKFLAIFLGPIGLGRFAILNDFITFTSSMASIGVSNSGVQAISKASTISNHKVKVVYNTLIRTFSVIALIVCIGIIILANKISILLVKNDSLTWFLRIASITVFFRLISQVQNSLITGMQQVALIAKGNIYQGLIVTVISILLVLILRQEAIPYLVILLALVTWGISYVQSRGILNNLPSTKEKLLNKEFRPILILGAATIWASLLENTVNIIAKSSISKHFSEAYLGYYQVAIGFTFQYIGFITASITSDYYPRLITTIEKGSHEVSKFVNQQIGISISLIMPLLLIMLTFSKLFIRVLFSSKFSISNELIGYSVAGTLLLVVCWPIAYVFLAHRATKTYFLTELVGNSSHLILILLAISLNNFSYLGLAYVFHYIIYLVLITIIFYKKFNGHLSVENIKMFILNAIIITIIIVGKNYFDDAIIYIIGSFLILFYFYFSRKEYQYMLQSITKKR